MASATGSRSAPTAFPTDDESLALKACLLDGDRALHAWRRLSAGSGREGAGITWIAPLLMANLARLAPEDPWVRENPHFLTLCELRTGAILEFAQATLRLLAEATIPTMALKGLALGASVYPRPGLRTVSDLDILVPGKDVFRAMELLVERGLRPGPGAPRTAKDLRANHAQAFYSSKKHEPSIDLHWHVLASARGDDDDTPFWAAAEPLRIGTTQTQGLSPEHQLLHALVHGVRWTRMPHVRWVADATLILRATKETFRTEKFLEAMQRFDVVAPVQEGLRFVAETIGEGHELLERAGSLRKSRFSERAFKARATAYERRSVADRIALRIETALWSQRAWRGRAFSTPRA